MSSGSLPDNDLEAARLTMNPHIRNRYSIMQRITLVYCLIRTKLLSPRARLIRFPFDLRGKKFVDFGRALTTGRYCRIEAFATESDDKNIKIKFGNNVQINDFVHISAIERIAIGDSVLMASHIYISDNSHGSYKGDEYDSDPRIPPTRRQYVTKPVSIGDNTWIGEGVMILPGAMIGKGCVIGAHSVVSEGIYPDYSMIVGTPARIVKRYNTVSNRWEKI